MMGALVEIARFYDPEEAYCAQGYLRACGIDSILQNEHHLAVAPHLRVALDGYRLMSFADFEGAAREALAEVADAKPVDGGKPEREAYPSRKNWFWLPTFFFFGAWPFLPRVRSAADVLLQGLVIGVLYLFIYLIFLHPFFF